MYKVCKHCKTKNLESAKYCFSCEQSFSKEVKKRVIAQDTPKVRVIDDPDAEDLDIDNPNLEISDTASAKLQSMIKVEVDDRPTGIRFEDVVGTMKGGRKAIGRRTSSDRRQGKAILRQEGGNSERFSGKKNS